MLAFCKKIAHQNSAKLAAFNLLVASYLCFMLLIGGAGISWLNSIFTIIFCLSLSLCGLLICSLIAIKGGGSGLISIFLMGMSIIGVMTMTFALVFDLPSILAYVISITSLILVWLPLGRLKSHKHISLDWWDVVAAATFIIFLCILIYLPTTAYPALLRTGALPLWLDYYIHGVTISSFGSSFADGTSMEVVGMNRSIYHYAPFALSGIYQAILNANGLIVAISFLLPFGLLIACFGGYLIANLLTNRFNSLIIIILVIATPFSELFIQSGWFDNTWTLFTSPGTGYAIGVAGCVILWLREFLDKKSKHALLMVIIFLLSEVFFRVHLFILLFPAILGVLLIEWGYKKLLLLFFFCLFLIFISCFYYQPLMDYWIKLSNPFVYLDLVIPWSVFYGQSLNYSESVGIIKIIIQLIIITTSILGFFVILYPIALLMKVKSMGMDSFDYLPPITLLTFILLTLYAPMASNGDLTEFKHRHFPLLYYLIAIYSLAYTFNFLQSKISLRIFQSGSLLMGTIAAIFAIGFASERNLASPKLNLMPWASGFFNKNLKPGVIDLALYLQANSKVGNSFAAHKSLISEISNPTLEIISISGVPSFLTRPEQNLKVNKQLVESRQKVLDSIDDASNWMEAKEIMRVNRIRWLLVSDASLPGWAKNSDSLGRRFDSLIIFDSQLN